MVRTTYSPDPSESGCHRSSTSASTVFAAEEVSGTRLIHQGRTPLSGGRKSGVVEKREHRSVLCEYENNSRTDGCLPGILPERGVHGKRTSWARQYREPWEGTSAVSLQDLREDI